MTLATTSALLFLAARLVFGGVLAFMGLNHFLDLENMAGYAESNGVPYPRLAVLGSGTALILGGLGIAAGIAPLLAAILIVGFFLVVTPTMHDFWNVEDPEQRQQQVNHFLKNAALTGGALLILAVGGAAWPLAVAA